MEIINPLEGNINFWFKAVPLFVWTMLLDRIPSKDNLQRKGVLNYNDQTCT